MKTTNLGRDGRTVGVIGLGCMGMTYAYDMDAGRDDAEMVSVIRASIDAGGNLLDTADAYGPFTNEELVGRSLAQDCRPQAGTYRKRPRTVASVCSVCVGVGRACVPNVGHSAAAARSTISGQPTRGACENACPSVRLG